MNEASTFNNNAWLVRLSEVTRLDGHALLINLSSSCLPDIQPEDAILITYEFEDKFTVKGIGRIYRKRYSLEDTSFYFDGYLPATPTATLDELTIPVPENKAPIIRLDWALFEKALKTTTGASWTAFPSFREIHPARRHTFGS